MKSIFYPKFLFLLLFITCNLKSFSQTVINYQTWTSASGCNIFASQTNVPATINGTTGNIAHLTSIGQPTYDNANKSINLISQATSTGYLGTEYRITANLKAGYSYKITINATRITTNGNSPNILLRTNLNNGGNATNTVCNGADVINASGSGNLNQSQSIANPSFSDYIFNYSVLPSAQLYLMIAGIVPSPGSSYQTILIRKITIQETASAELTLSPASLPIVCGNATNQTFTVSNPYNVPNITSYEWNLGSSNNGWRYNGNAAPQNISTPTNSLTLSSLCGNLPQNVSVTVKVSGQNYKTYVCSISNNNNISLSISGSNSICSGTSTYQINNLPCNATVSWSSSNTNIASVYPLTGNPVTVTKAGDGKATITATVSGTCPVVLNKNIVLGFPAFTDTIVGTKIATPNGQHNYTLVLPLGYPSASYNWWVTPSPGWSIVTGQGTNTVKIKVNAVSGILNVDVTACGVNRGKFATIAVGTGGGTPDFVDPVNGGKGVIRVAPNPSSNTTTVSLLPDNRLKVASNSSIKEIRITDKIGTLKRQMKYAAGKVNQTIDVSGLPKDVYTISVFDGTSWRATKIIVQ